MARIRRIKKRKPNAARRREVEVEALLHPDHADEPNAGANRVVLVGERIFNAKMTQMLSEVEGLKLVASASTPKDALAYPNEFDAELTVIDVDFTGPGEGVALARDIGERSPGCAIMLVCSTFTANISMHLWVFGTESWSMVSQATAKNPLHFAEAVNSAVHGITWVEPGIQRELRKFGVRPRSLDERKMVMFERANREAS